MLVVAIYCFGDLKSRYFRLSTLEGIFGSTQSLAKFIINWYFAKSANKESGVTFADGDGCFS